MLGNQDSVRAISRQLLGRILNTVSQYNGNQFPPQGIGHSSALAQGFKRHFPENAVHIFRNGKYILRHDYSP